MAIKGDETEPISGWAEEIAGSLGASFLVDSDDDIPGLVLPDRAAVRVCSVLLTNVG